MSWLGAGIGAGIGAVIGGPIGAGIGAWIGSAFGNGSDKIVVVCPHCNANVEVEYEGQWECDNCHKIFSYGDNAEDRQTIFFVTFFSMLGKMSKLDGVVSEKEIAMVTSFFDDFGLDAEDKKAAIKIFNNAKSDNSNIYEYAEQYARIAEVEMSEVMYEALWKVALSDGELHPYEDLVLQKILPYLRLPQSRYDEFKNYSQNTSSGEYNNYSQNRSSSDIEECYKILDCTESDTDQVIKQKYKKAVAEYHPDKIQSKGLPQGFLDFANDRVKKINQAYETIKARRKFS